MNHSANDEERRLPKYTISKKWLLIGVVAVVGIGVIGYCTLKADAYDKTFDRFYELGTRVCLYLPDLKMNKGWTRLPSTEVRKHVVYLDDRPNAVGIDLTALGPEESISLVKKHPQAARCIALDLSLLRNDAFLEVLRDTVTDYLVLSLSSSSVYSPENIEGLLKLDRCSLYLPNPIVNVNDEVLSNLAKCKRIEMLKIRGLKSVTDIGMRHIGEMAQLRCLAITTRVPQMTYQYGPSSEIPGITGDGIACLKGCTKLRKLTVRGIKVSSEAANAISELRRLQNLELTYASLGDGCLAHIGNIGSLKRLYLSDNPSVSDRGIEHLSDLRLQVLTLSGTAITDSGLEHLMGMHSLITVSVSNTQVTGKGIQKFNQALKRD